MTVIATRQLRTQRGYPPPPAARNRRPLPPAPGPVPPAPMPGWVDAVPLTPRERDVVRYVNDYRSANKVSPTLAEVAGSMRVTRVTVCAMAHSAARKGVLLIDRGKGRSLRLAGGPGGRPGEADRLNAECILLRELSAGAMALMNRYAALYAGGELAGPRERAAQWRAEMRRLAARIAAALAPGGPGNGGGRGE